jgi:hypothetical protein
MPKPALTIPTARVEQYDALVATQPDVLRKGATMPYTALNGNMFSFLSPNGTLALRLPADAREAFLHKYATELFKQGTTVLREYVVVPEPLWKKPKELAKHFAAAYGYAKTLKPKPSRGAGPAKATSSARPASISRTSKR